MTAKLCKPPIGFLVAMFLCWTSHALAVDEVEPTETASLEKAAPTESDLQAIQAAEQKVAAKAMPFISGIAFQSLDPESPQTGSMLVFKDGQLMLTQGESTVSDGQFAFAADNAASSSSGSVIDHPANRALMLTAIKWLAISAIIGWPFVAFVLRGTLFEDEHYDPTFGSLLFSGIGWIANVLVLSTIGMLFMLSIRRPEIWPGAPNLHLQHVALATVGLAVALGLSLVGSIMAWTKGYWRIPGRLHYSLTVISGLAFLWYLYRVDVLQQLLQYLA